MTLIKINEQFLGEAYQCSMEKKIPKAVQCLEGIQDKTCVGAEWTGWWDYPQVYGFNLVDDVKAIGTLWILPTI